MPIFAGVSCLVEVLYMDRVAPMYECLISYTPPTLWGRYKGPVTMKTSLQLLVN